MNHKNFGHDSPYWSKATPGQVNMAGPDFRQYHSTHCQCLQIECLLSSQKKNCFALFQKINQPPCA